ncbi:Conserved oligomeric Golgi complex subunit [Dionaea muscipula]
MASPAIQRSPIASTAAGTITSTATTNSVSSPLQRLSTFKDRDRDHQPSSGLTHSSPPTDPLSSFSTDPIFSLFLSPDFDSLRFSSHALSTGSAASTAENLQNGIRLLEQQLRSEVLSRHQDLLSQLSSLRDAESALSVVRSAVSSLHSSLRRVRSEIADPNRQIRSKTTQLSNLHQTYELLQFTIRVIRLSKKLRDLMAVSESDPEKLDLMKAAQLHFEILGLASDNGLSGIDVVDEELRWVSETGVKLRAEGMKILERGLEGLNQAEVGSGLQVFYNLGELRATIDGLINKYKNVGVKSIVAAVDMKAISSTAGGGSGFGPGGVQRSGTPQIGGGAKAKEALWQRMSVSMDQLHSLVVAVWHLQRVLSKKRDPFTHVLLLDEVLQDGDPMLTDRIWEAFVKSFASQMKSAFTASSFVKEIFTMGYPKLYSMVENLLERISRDTDVKGVLPAVSSDGKDQMLAAIEIFQTAFLGLCLSRLSDLVNTVFPVSSRGSVPSKDHVSKIVLRIQEEIEAVQFNSHLTLLVLREIGKVLRLLAERAEYQISTGPEARQITGPATASQLKNFALCQHLQEVHTRVSSLMAGLPRQASDVLSPHLDAVYGVAYLSVQSLFEAMLERLKSCILQIHEQNFGSAGIDSTVDNNASPYMEELQKQILHFRSEFLSRLLPSFSSASTGTETICTKLTRNMASRVLIFFIRHASLVRPLSESGKLRMARDMAELELAVGQNLFPVEQLGAHYRALRAFRPVIFLEVSQLEASPLLQDLPPSVILHHLYSRGPDELQSPIQKNKLTPLQYSLWLDSQGEDQIWKGIKATLDDYAMLVRTRGDKQFSPVYPIMLRIGSLISENIALSRNT